MQRYECNKHSNKIKRLVSPSVVTKTDQLSIQKMIKGLQQTSVSFEYLM